MTENDKKVKTYYCDAYGAETTVLSMRKLPFIAEGVRRGGFGELTAPKNIDTVGEKLRRLHDPKYVDAYLAGESWARRMAGFGASDRIAEGVLASNAGTLEAAADALAGEKLTASISQGFHHSTYDGGGGFCTFNGLALIAAENPTKKIFVLDCDEHQGNGTKDFVRRLPNLYSFSIYGSFFGDGEEIERAWDRESLGWELYQKSLEEGIAVIAEVKPDLVIYQAGVDCGEGDGLGENQLTDDQLEQRDRFVFRKLLAMGMPTTFVMAGGYGEDAIRRHINTFRQAHIELNAGLAAQASA